MESRGEAGDCELSYSARSARPCRGVLPLNRVVFGKVSQENSAQSVRGVELQGNVEAFTTIYKSELAAHCCLEAGLDFAARLEVD